MVMKNRHCSSCMRWGSLQYPAFTTSTTAWLSQWTNTTFLLQVFPHTMHAIMIGSSSFAAMDCCLRPFGQDYWNQDCSDHALQPKEPEASVYRWKGTDFHDGSSNMDIPFQDSRNRFHHMRSERSVQTNKVLLF